MVTTGSTATQQAEEYQALRVETNGINVIPDAERKGAPRQLFWPWFGANISVFALSYGSFGLSFGVSFWQALIAGLLGIALSFLLCGFIALAGKRGSAPTMVLSRAPFGVRGNTLPALLAWLVNVGWETVLTILATLATATVFDRLGWSAGTATKVIALIVVAALIIAGGVMGFDLIMRMQAVITVVTGVLTVVYIVLVFDKIHWHTVSSVPSGSAQHVIGCFVLFFTGFGLGWVVMAADYSRYLPRRASSAGVIGWTAFGGAVAPAVLLVFGLLLAGSSEKLNSAIAADPIGALAAELHTWALVPFLIVVVLGLVGGAVLDIYSSGLALLTAGLRVPPAGRGADRRGDHGGRRHLRRLLRRQLLPAVPGLPDHARRSDRRLVRGDAGRHPAAPTRLCRAGAVRPARPVRQRAAGAAAVHPDRHRARLGPGDQQLRQLADLAGLPARPVRSGWQDRQLGVRQPRRAGGVGPRFRGYPARRPRPDSAAGVDARRQEPMSARQEPMAG